MKYFGVALPQDLSQLKSINYAPLISQIKSDTGKWNLVMFTSLDSRIKVIKMNVLPRLLHLLQTRRSDEQRFHRMGYSKC